MATPIPVLRSLCTALLAFSIFKDPATFFCCAERANDLDAASSRPHGSHHHHSHMHDRHDHKHQLHHHAKHYQNEGLATSVAAVVPGGALHRLADAQPHTSLSEEKSAATLAESSRSADPGEHAAEHEETHSEGDHHGGEDGEDGHGHGHHGPVFSAGTMEQEFHSGYVAGWTIILFTLGLVGLLYLLNYPDPQVHSYSYKLMSHISSILCALLFEKSQAYLLMQTIVSPLFGLPHGIDEICCAIPFVLTFFLIRPVCHWRRKDPNDLFATENILGHLAAFIGIEMFNEPMEWCVEKLGWEDKWAKRLAFYGFAPLFAFALVKCMQFLSRILGERMVGIKDEERMGHGHGHGAAEGHAEETHAPEQHAPQPKTEEHAEESEDDVDAHVWLHATSTAQIECSAIMVGFLIKEFGEQMKAYAVGHSPYADGHLVKGVWFMAAYTLFWCVLFLGVLAKKSGIVESIGEDYFKEVQDHLGMTGAWCMFTTAKWFTYVAFWTNDAGSVLKAFTVRKMLIALWVTPTMIIILIVLDQLADRGILDDVKAGSILACTGLVVGIAWEQCYGSAVRTIALGSGAAAAELARTATGGLSEKSEHLSTSDQGMDGGIIQVILGFVICAILIPGWKRFIVPTARLPMPPRHGDQDLLLHKMKTGGHLDEAAAH